MSTAQIGMVALYAAGVAFPSENASTRPYEPTKSSGLAVVFRWVSGKRVLIGTARDASFAPKGADDLRVAGKEAGNRVPHDGDYEVWFLGEGLSEGYCADASRTRAAKLDLKGRCGFDGPIAERVKSAISSAAPVKPVRFETARPLPAGTVPTFGPSQLKVLVGSSHVIVVGRAAGIVRMNHTPVNHSGEQQHTVYAFAVERYLKSDRWGAPAVKKVHQEGGDLPWKDPLTGAAGVGYRSALDPPLQVGERYILFLRWMGDGKGWPPFIGTEVGGVRGKVADMDEYEYTHAIRGKLLLKDGFTRPAELSGQPELDAWSFRSGTQILNVPEPEAVREIIDEVNRER